MLGVPAPAAEVAETRHDDQATASRFRAKVPIVPDVAEVEALLRLAGERLLLDADSGHGERRLGDLAAALVLLCGLPRDIAVGVLNDYRTAHAFRGHGPPPQFLADGPPAVSRALAGSVPTAAPVVRMCSATVDLPDGLVDVGLVVFTRTPASSR